MKYKGKNKNIAPSIEWIKPLCLNNFAKGLIFPSLELEMSMSGKTVAIMPKINNLESILKIKCKKE